MVRAYFIAPRIMTAAIAESFRRDAKVIGLVGLAHGTSHFFHLALASLFPWLKDAFVLSYAELGLLMTVFFIVSGVGQALAGFVVDRFGALPVLLGGIAGLGNSVFHPADFTLLNRRVTVPRLGHAFSVHGLAGTLGWALAPVFLAGIATIAGWRLALLAAAALAFVVLAALAVFRDLLDPREVQQAVAKPSRDPGGSILGFMSAPVWMCFAFFLISSFAFGGIQSFAPAALRDIYEIPFALATACITAYMLASAGGIVAGGFLAARVAHHDRIVAAGFAASGAIAVLVATGIPPAASVIVLLGLIGFGAGIVGPSRDLLVRAAAPKNATGRVYGVVYSGLDIGLSVAPTLFGLLMDWRHPSWVFVGIGLFQVLALFAALGVGGTAIKRGMQTA